MIKAYAAFEPKGDSVRAQALSTVNVKLDWNAYLGTLAPKGRLHFVGATLEPLDLQAFSLIGQQRSVSGSRVGSPTTINDMLQFAALHQIEPVVEQFGFSQINEAIAHVESGKARYRVVLENTHKGIPQ
ncbi:MAG: zinc-binding dehydrogenase [Limnobacter sp.]|nr:zinc-binding dehydrogenase [Limnobacter sp.]